MARVLLCWELGGNFGHLARLHALAIALRERGHEPVFAVRDLSDTETVLGANGYTLLQAPVWNAHVQGLPVSVGYAETLLQFGYYDADSLTGIVRGWRSLLDLVRPDLLVFDHAPTALLATHGGGIPRVLYGTGFGSPPRSDPLPAYQWWRPEPRSRLVDSERQVLGVANKVLARLAAPPLDRLADLFAADADLLLTFPELDHYPKRAHAIYLGPVFGLDRGVAPRWSIAGTGRVFAYLRPGYPQFEQALHALNQCGASVVVYAPGTAARTEKTHSSATVAFSSTPVDMEVARRECDLGICHAGLGTIAALLTAGKPMLMLPVRMEQLMLAKRVEALGAGIAASGERAVPYARLLHKLLAERSYTEAAQAFAHRHAGFDSSHAARYAAARCDALLQSRQA